MQLDSIVKDGYFYQVSSTDKANNIAKLCLLSCLEAFCRTADDLEPFYGNPDCDNTDQNVVDALYPRTYAKDSCDAILKFQMFIELFLKDILMEIDPMLVYDANRMPTVLYKLIRKESVCDADLEKTKLIECSDAIDRFQELFRNGHVSTQYQFVYDNVDLLRKLNTLRNRIVHRGAFILRPTAFNELFGAYIIPFLDKLESLDPYKDVLNWNIFLNNPDIDIYRDLQAEYKLCSPNETKVHLLKKMGAAAYRNEIKNRNLPFLRQYYEERRRIAEKKASVVAQESWCDVDNCPVCGCNTFIIETDTYDEEDEDGNVINYNSYVYETKCTNCGFHINSHWIGKIKESGLPLKDYGAI